MQENQVSNSTFQTKINQLREKILKMDGVASVDGISDEITSNVTLRTALVQTNIEKG